MDHRQESYHGKLSAWRPAGVKLVPGAGVEPATF
jgi:hypothetical protein